MNRFLYVLSIVFLLSLSGCSVMGDVQENVCANMDDKDHCYQDAAIRWNKPELCDKVQRAAPQSKCWLLMAEKWNEVKFCDNMKVGDGTYDKQQCIMLVAIKDWDPKLCEQMGNYQHSLGNDVTRGPINKEACLDKVFSICGKEGGSCCKGLICDKSLTCKKEQNKPSVCARLKEGALGQPCFKNAEGEMACDGSLKCGSKGVCVNACGWRDDPCCYGYQVAGWCNIWSDKEELKCISDVCVLVNITK